MIRTYITIAVVALVASLGGYIYWQNLSIGKLEARVIELEFAVQSCLNRNDNLQEDKQSDNKIDQVPDSTLPNLVRPDWMLPEGGSDSE